MFVSFIVLKPHGENAHLVIIQKVSSARKEGRLNRMPPKTMLEPC